LRKVRHSELKGWEFLSPTLVLLLFLGVVPILYVIYLSLFRYDLFSVVGMRYIGLDNYRKLFSDPVFLYSLALGLRFAATTCVIQIFLGLILALFLARNFTGKGLVRGVISLPIAVAPVAIGSVWILLTNVEVGPLPYLAEKIFGIQYNIGLSAGQAFLTVVIMDVWHWTPFVTLAFLAALTMRPQEPLEAAKIDGASSWQSFRYVTLPFLEPVLITVVLIRVMDALRIYDEVRILTDGGPGSATRFVSIHIAKMVVSQARYGYSATMSVFVLYLTIVICWLLYILISRRGGAGATKAA